MKHILLSISLLFIINSFAQQKNESIGFIENKGQIIDQNGNQNTAVQFLLNTNGLNVQIKKNGFSYDIYEVKKNPVKQRIEENNTFSSTAKNDKKTPDYTLEYVFHRIDIDFVNSNQNVKLISSEKSNDYDNYYNVPNKPEGILGVHKFKQITYKNIYPNIDVVFSIPKDSLKPVEYNFVIHPNGKIADIQLKFNGVKTELVDNKIKMNVRFGKMEEILPASWMEDGTTKKEITVGYKKIKNNVYGFNTSNSINGKTVIIDPVPTRLWGTFYGDGSYTEFTDIDSDSQNNSYFCGNVSGISTNYASSWAHQTNITNSTNYGSDGIIAKFDSNGQRVWGTYYGGIDNDKINGLVIDKYDNVIITGYTYSFTNIATPGSFKPEKTTQSPFSTGNNSDAFIVKFNTTGVRIWGSYFGDFEEDSASDLDIDINNNIYIIGKTNSISNISKNTNYQNNLNRDVITYPNRSDSFLGKFNSDGNLIWATYAGGEDEDYFTTIKVATNYLVVGGNTRSLTNISTLGAFQENKLGNVGSSNGTIYKFTLNGERLWSTYYSGILTTEIKSIEVDDENSIYVGGSTYSNTNIATLGSFDDYNDEWQSTGFIGKLNSNSNRIWGTYVGRNSDINTIKFKNNHIYISGMGSFDNSITTNCAYRRNGFNEGYLGKFSKNCELILGTYTGGFNRVNELNKICIDNNNNIIMGGDTEQNNGIADSQSYQSSINGSSNFYLIKFEETTINGIPKLESNSPLCIGNTLELKASGGNDYLWTGPNGFTSTDQNPIIPNATALNSGEYSCFITGTGGCDDTKTVDVIIGDIEAPIPDLANLPTIAVDCNTTITTIPTANDACAGAITATTVSPLNYNLPGTYTIVWNYNDGNGNNVNQNQSVTITSQPLPTVNTPQTFCIQQNTTINTIAITGQNIKWYNSLTNGNLLVNTASLQNGTYYASQTINGCESERVAVLINIQNTPAPTANANQSFCSDSNATIAAIQITGNSIKWYDALNNGSLLAETTNLIDGETYYASQTANNCESERFGVSISIVNTPAVPTANATQSFCKNENATVDNIQILEQNIKWYETNVSTTVLANTTLLEDNKTYYASQNIGCESDRTPILIRVYDTPLPIANNNQQFCIDENATIDNLSISGSNIKWYDEPTNGTILAETTLLQNDKIYYVTQTLNDCESERLAITVKIQDTQIPIANSPQTFCIQKKAKISDILISGQNINWYDNDSSSIHVSESTLLENGMTYYASETINNCESERIPISITILEATTTDCINFVDELPYPKFFTPNNDGYNDTWSIDFAYLKLNTTIQIFDRYGKLLKVLLPNSAWNGQYNNHPLPATDYWFSATRANGQEYKGHFSLKR